MICPLNESEFCDRMGQDMKIKKPAVMIAASGVLFAVIWAVATFPQSPRPHFPPKPEDTILEFWICDDVSAVDWSGHDEIDGWMGAQEFLGKDYCAGVQGERPPVRVSYILTAWPDYADEGSYVTTIEITDPSVSVYGLTVESGAEEFEQVMTSMGYHVELVDDGFQRAVRDGFTFSLHCGDEPELRISAEVSNHEGIVF